MVAVGVAVAVAVGVVVGVAVGVAVGVVVAVAVGVGVVVAVAVAVGVGVVVGVVVVMHPGERDDLERRVPDDREPEDNIPDAVRDAGFSILLESGPAGRIWTVDTDWLNDAEMIRLAHAILAEVEIAQRTERGEFQ